MIIIIHNTMKKIIAIIITAMLAFSAVAAAGPRKKVKDIREVTFAVHLHCQNCVNKVQENVAFEKGVKDLKVSLDDQTVYVRYDAARTDAETLKKSIESLGYPVSGVVEPGLGHEHHHEHHNDHSHE